MIEINNVSYSYGKNTVLKDISLDISPGDCVGILGNNGAGKSTFITCLNRINVPKTGTMQIHGKNVFHMSRNETAQNIAYVPQKNELSQITVFDAVLLGRKPYIKWGVSQEDLDICDEMLDKIGLTDFKLRYINELSGGEVQKVMLARAFVQQPKLLLLDEPTSNLDPKNQYEMMALVQKMVKERNISALIVIHDLSLALRYCNKFLFIKEGVVYGHGDASIITKETISAVYDIEATVENINGRKVVVIG